MVERTAYAPGTPNWVDLQSPDVEASRAFYGPLFGWELFNAMGDGGEYWMASLRGVPVAAIAGHNPERTLADAPARWNTYLATDDVDGVVAKTVPAGGTVVLSGFDVPGAGRMGWIADPSGPDFGLWQAGEHLGSGLANEPGTVMWNELVTNDLHSALPFYETVLGIDAVPMPMGDGSYTILRVEGNDVGGATNPPMPGAPNHWHVYFAVVSTDDSAAKATDLGASVIVEPFDIPTVGRVAIIQDPQGGFFSLLQPSVDDSTQA